MNVIKTTRKFGIQQASTKRAISYGGDIVGFEQLPSVLSETLLLAAANGVTQKIIHIGPDGAETAQSYPELLREAKCVLAGFRKLGLRPGDAIIFQCELSRDFLPAFWGAILGGFLPVPVSVPADYQQDNASVLKVRNAWELLGKPLVLTSERRLENLRSLERFPALKEFRSAAADQLRANEPDEAIHPAEPEDLALMMLTSGSTGVPKGVMLNHRNLISRSAGSMQMNRFSPEDISLSWMPLDHVASLIYFHLRDVFTGCTQIHVAPTFILQSPLRWIDLIHRFRVNVTFAPNFAFGLVNERADEMSQHQWELSCIRYFLNGGEAVVPRTARRFVQLLCAHGLRPDTMFPAWGMSEISSGVTYGDRFGLNTTSDEDQFTEVGLPIPGTWLRIVNEHDEAVQEGEIGRLQFKGLTLMSGYYNNPGANHEAFTVDGWFKTGDLGYLRDARLTITGREKDVIIINGVNYYSHEIESVVEQIPGVEVSFVGACAVRDAQNQPEKLAIFFSCTEQGKSNCAELFLQIRGRVAQQNGIKPEYLVPLEKWEIPKTEIGKIQRAKLKARFDAGEFSEIVQQVEKSSTEHRKQHAPETEAEKKIASIWSEVLGVDDIGRNESFFAVGGASLAANRVISRVREQLNVELPLALLFNEDMTLQKVAEYVSTREKSAGRAIEPVSGTEAVPVSVAQQRIWIAEQMEPGTCRFNVARALWLKGPLDSAALEKALNEIVHRHDILRTTFSFKDTLPVQIVTEKLPLHVPRIDLKSAGNPAQAALDLAHADLNEPFDLTKLPLVRAKLFEVSDSRHLLAICFHQIIVDGWSIGVLFAELAAQYERFAGDTAAAAEPLPVQYRDYTAWQRAHAIPGHHEQLNYWKQQLSGNVPRLDWIPAKTVSPKATTKRLILQRELCDKIKAFNRKENATLFMTLLAAYKVLLRSNNSTDDISVGTAVSGRNRVEIEKLIGFFVNTVVLRTQVSPEQSFRGLVENVRKISLDAFGNSDVPFEQLVETLHSRRVAEGTPFFQAWFSFMDAMPDFQVHNLVATPIHVAPPEAQFDLSLFIVERGEEIDCFFEYKSELLDPVTINNLTTAYENLLNHVVNNPETRLRETLITGTPLPVTTAEPEEIQTIHSWIELQVAARPDAIAVTCGKESISYGELNKRANQLARYLKTNGVRKGEFVGISLPRSVEMLVAILGVLKTGGAYVPLDPAYPGERIEQMLAEIQAPVLLANSRTEPGLPSDVSKIVCMDSDWSSISRESDLNLVAEVGPGDIAYAIFTSGSTGRPKGVPITHGNLIFSNKARFSYYEEPVRAYLMISSFSFDSSVAGIFWTLCSGGNLVLPEDELHRDPVELIRAIEQNRVTHFLGLPSLYNLMLHESHADKMGSLREVIVAGEACSNELIEHHAKVLPHARLFNEYGPTEATVWSTVARLLPGNKVTIGQAIPGAEVYLLDEQMNPVKTGETGEIFIGGPGVSSGYLNRPEVTATRFVPAPLNKASGLLYRTGDLARYLDDGNIEFLGRMDHQVKIRGFRIELEEIEAVLREYPGIRNSVVNAYEPANSLEKVLVAYLVSSENLDTQDLRQFLKVRLPEYMVPGAFVCLDALPLMPNGKVDRPALPAPKVEQASEVYIGPRTPIEEQISGIWTELLQRERISVNQDFFELGGHSLVGIQVMARVRAQFQIEMPLKHIFEAPTIAGLAERVFEHLMAADQTTSDEFHAAAAQPSVRPVTGGLPDGNLHKTIHDQIIA
ncbi:MAG: amino acid adenylation domain-containing protein [Verrucomicrobia bacterium]|nr:amino acid adenylation domain-containing protein [Verrucomicrobiota bacterium]